MDIRTYLFKKELTVAQLAESCGLSRAHLTLVMNGKRPITKKTFLLIEIATGGKVTKRDLEKIGKKKKKSK